MTPRLLNQTIMPRPGIYRMRQLPPQDWGKMVRKHKPIGYHDMQISGTVIDQVLGGEVFGYHEKFDTIVDGDWLFIARRNTKVLSVEDTVEGYEFFVCEFNLGG